MWDAGSDVISDECGLGVELGGAREGRGCGKEKSWNCRVGWY